MINIYNKQGQVVSEREIPEQIFGLPLNPDLVYQVYTSFVSNQRRPLAFTKDRSEVSGGGKKPWAQKGTGRARHGSIRSPLWVKGGITFGPRQKEENFSKKINKKMKKAGVKMVLSQKLKDNEIKVIDNFDLGKIKTKEASVILKNLFAKDVKKSILILLSNEEQNLRRAFRNLPSVEIARTADLNISHLLNNKFILLSQNSLQQLEKQLV